MKQIISIFLVLLSSFIFAQATDITSICAYQNNIFHSKISEPLNLKGLKKLKKEATKDEVFNYAFELYLQLKTRENSSLSPEKKSQMTAEIVKSYILPEAQAGRLNAITLILRDFNMPNSISHKYLTNCKETIGAKKYMEFQAFVANKWTMQENWANDSLLREYFLTFKKEDLKGLRDTLDFRVRLLKKTAGKNGDTSINQSGFCQTMSQDGVYTFYGAKIGPSPLSFMIYLKNVINLILYNEEPKALAQVLYAFKNHELTGLSMDYLKTSSQWFASDKENGPIIFKLLSSCYDHFDSSSENIAIKSYYLNRAAEVGDVDAYYNLACLYDYHYKKTERKAFNDSCIKYIELALALQSPGAYTLKGLKTYNGDGYVTNKKEGVLLLRKGRDLGESVAISLLSTMPEERFGQILEGYYFRESIKVKSPWDLMVRCSNGCGKYTYPQKIYFGYKYDHHENPQVLKPIIKEDDFFNPVLSFGYDDFTKTMAVAHMGYQDWKHVMCSSQCQKSHENTNEKSWSAASSRRTELDNEVIKCSNCQKRLKRKDMYSISECPCHDDSGQTMNVGFGDSHDLYGQSEPKVCSKYCQTEFCRNKCASKGLKSNQ